MVVVPEPAVKRGGAFAAAAVDRAVGPAVDQGAYEALCLAVRLRPVGTSAQVTDAERATGERVDRGAVATAVVGEHAFDGDPVSTVEGDGTAEEAGRGRGFLIGEHLRVGEAAVDVDGDVDVLPADQVETDAGGVVGAAAFVLAQTVAESLAGAAFDPAELLDVNVQELARPRAFVADRLLEPDPAQAAHAAAREHRRARREWHIQRHRDLRCR